MSVRAKFKVSKIEYSMGSKPVTDDNGNTKWVSAPMTTIVLNPVFGNGDPDHENTKFWQASPSGEIRLGCVNQNAVAQFELDKDYYIDFTAAEPTEAPDPNEREHVLDSATWELLAEAVKAGDLETAKQILGVDSP